MSDELIPPGWTKRDSKGFPELVGPILLRRDEQGTHYAFRVQEKHLNARGDVHGGMMATFADQALGLTVHQKVGFRPAATIQLNIQYVSATHLGDFVESKVEVVRITRSLVFVRAFLMAGDKVLVAADGIWKMLGDGTAPPEPPQKRQ